MQREPSQLILANLSTEACLLAGAHVRRGFGGHQGAWARAWLPAALLALAWIPGPLFAQEKLSPSNLPQFLKLYDTNFPLLDQVYRELTDEALPLRDTAGQPLERRRIQDRRQALNDLRQNALRLAISPQDLVAAATLVLKTEELADDLFDLSQIAYDNDREELGKRLSDLQITMANNKDTLAAYLLALAAQKQERINQLEKEKAELERKLKGPERPGQTAP